MLYDRKTEACATALTGTRYIHPVEPLGQAWYVFGRNADAGILDGKAGLSPVLVPVHCDRSAR